MENKKAELTIEAACEVVALAAALLLHADGDVCDLLLVRGVSARIKQVAAVMVSMHDDDLADINHLERVLRPR